MSVTTGKLQKSNSKKSKKYQVKGRQVSDTALIEIQSILGDRPRRADLLIEYLHLIQDEYKHVSADHMAALAKEMRLAMAEVYEVATFYHHFDVVKEGDVAPPPLTVRVCDGITCEMMGAKTLKQELLTKYGTGVRVISAPCVGACDRAPVAVVGQNQVHKASVQSVISAVEANNIFPEETQYINLDNYLDTGGYRTWKSCLDGSTDRVTVCEKINKSGLKGLGGAGFPTARKWSFLDNAPKPRLVAINADEGEPGTFKDRHCLETDPHRVLEGILIASWAVEASAAYIYLRDEYPYIRNILLEEIAKLEKMALTGGIKIHLRRGAGAYICGEESAMLESIEGKRGLPRNRPPFPAQKGLFGQPTLINNVETMFWLRDIMEKGPDWYQETGRPHFISASGRIKEPGIKMVPAGITAKQLINDYCGGMEDGHEFYAFLPGGASGGILPADKGDVPMDFGTLDEFGCFVGSSAVVIFSKNDKIGDICKNLIHFFEDESCGQCTPCRIGCEKMLKLIDKPVWDKALVTELSETMRDASICGLGQAAPNPVLSAIRFFAEDIE
jgi:NADH:ubiquinone oxidoreductase subunit F (NADH-binding)/NADH:ubiquinone oxidoreductase subunit E